MDAISKEEKQVLSVIGALLLVGMLFYGITHLSGCRKNDSETVFDIPSANAAVVTMSAEICVHVAGAVYRPGVYAVPQGSRAWQAVRAAGGALPNADLDSVNLSRSVADGEKVLVKAMKPRTYRAVRRRTIRIAGKKCPRSKSRDSSKINMNTASLEELDTLPGVGPGLARKIMEYRAVHLFQTPEELLKVKGIRKNVYEGLRDRIEI